MSFFDFNTAESQQSYGLIPKGTYLKVKLAIIPGGHNDEVRGWMGGFATKSKNSDSVFLNCEYTIQGGQYNGRKIWSRIGLYSDKNDNKWGNMGRSFIRSMLSSARGYSDKDDSEAAQAARRINGLGDLNGLEFLTKIDVEEDQHGNDKNAVKNVITLDDKNYQTIVSEAASSENMITVSPPSLPDTQKNLWD